MKNVILKKLQENSGEEIVLTEKELLFIVRDWINENYRDKEVSKINTFGYLEDIHVKHGLKIKLL